MVRGKRSQVETANHTRVPTIPDYPLELDDASMYGGGSSRITGTPPSRCCITISSAALAYSESGDIAAAASASASAAFPLKLRVERVGKAAKLGLVGRRAGPFEEVSLPAMVYSSSTGPLITLTGLFQLFVLLLVAEVPLGVVYDRPPAELDWATG